MSWSWNFVNRLLALARGDEGQDLLEYALLVALIALVAVRPSRLAGTNVNDDLRQHRRRARAAAA